MHSLSLRTEKAEQLDGLRAGPVEPVRQPRVELGCLARFQHEVVLAKHEAQPAAQDVQPLIALMHLQVRLVEAPARWDDELVRLQPAGSASQWQNGHPVARSGLGVDTRVGGGPWADQLIERAACRFKPFGEVLVVTDDVAERDIVTSFGAVASSCDNFIRSVESGLAQLEREVRAYNQKERTKFRTS